MVSQCKEIKQTSNNTVVQLEVGQACCTPTSTGHASRHVVSPMVFSPQAEATGTPGAVVTVASTCSKHGALHALAWLRCMYLAFDSD